MDIPFYQVDAFTDRPFRGNPAAVCPLEAWLSEAQLQAIAEEFNLSETAFLVKESGGYRIRWFTLATEVDLCGHATLAAAHIIFTTIEPDRVHLRFHSISGPLEVERLGAWIRMNFPACPPARIQRIPELGRALGAEPRELWKGRDLIVLLDSEEEVRDIRPHMSRLAELEPHGVIVTAKGDEADFVSRFFSPRSGIPEDPVTGSAHCALVPFWAARLGKVNLEARQLSKRGGLLKCEMSGDRVFLAGQAVKVVEGVIHVS